MTNIPITKHFIAAIAELSDVGEIIVRSMSGERVTIALGPAQITMLKISVDRYMANVEAENQKAEHGP